jgi:predicted nucleic acid-binding protein
MTNSGDAFVIDTHSLIWRFGGGPQLPEQMHAIFDAAERREARLLIPTIVLSELLHLYEGRMPQIRLEQIMDSVLSIPTYTVFPYDLPIFLEVRRMPGELQIHDRIIGATGRHYGVPVMTRDGVLKSLVDTVW